MTIFKQVDYEYNIKDLKLAEWSIMGMDWPSIL